jgi:hypothetical protein
MKRLQTNSIPPIYFVSFLTRRSKSNLQIDRITNFSQKKFLSFPPENKAISEAWEHRATYLKKTYFILACHRKEKNLFKHISTFSDIAPVQRVVCTYFEKTGLVFKCCILYKIIVRYIKNFVSCRNEFFSYKKDKIWTVRKIYDGWRDVIGPVIVSSFPWLWLLLVVSSKK